LSTQRKTPEWNKTEKTGGNMASFFHSMGGGLPEKHPAYILRRKLDDEALRVAVQGQLFQVIAPRQVGKTSLLYHLRWRLQEQGWRCVVVDLARLRNLKMAVWYEALGHMLAAELTPGLQLTLTNHLTLFEYLTGKAMHERYGSPQVAVFFDAVENALGARDEQGEPFSDTFFSAIRSHYDNSPHPISLTIGLASAISSRHLVSDKRISPFSIGSQLDIDDFNQTETREFTSCLGRLQVSIDEDTHNEIYAWTHGHPYLTHRICAELERRATEEHLPAMTEETVRQAVQALFLQPARPQLKDSNILHAHKMLNNLSPVLQPIWERIRQGQPKLYGSVDSETFDDLYMTGVIIKSQDGYLAIRNRIYAEVFQAKEASDQANTSLEQKAPAVEAKRKNMSKKQVGQVQDASEKTAQHNPWISGSFYLLAFVIVVAALCLAIFFLPWYAIPLLLVGGIVALIVIGAFQLRMDEKIPGASFMELMRLSFKSFPLIFRSTNTKPDSGKK
jgi:hypothetical protein